VSCARNVVHTISLNRRILEIVNSRGRARMMFNGAGISEKFDTFEYALFARIP
jgi:hypothetical protein